LVVAPKPACLRRRKYGHAGFPLQSPATAQIVAKDYAPLWASSVTPPVLRSWDVKAEQKYR
jgi:hypothetical protein